MNGLGLPLLGYAAEQAAGMRVLRAVGVESEVELLLAGLHQLPWPVLDQNGHGAGREDGASPPREEKVSSADRPGR